MPRDRRARPRWWAALPLALAPLAGCGDDKPRAPALTTEAVYQYDPAGLRVLTPDGWVLFARGNPPPRSLDHPFRLAAYQKTEGQARAELELYAIDLPDGQDLLAYLAAHPIGPEKWSAKGPPQAEKINGVEAVRYTQSATWSKGELRRELVAFRRPDRTYLFTLAYPATEPQLRDQARRSIESATWR